MSVIAYKYEVKIVRYIVQPACNIQVLVREILIDHMMSMIWFFIPLFNQVANDSQLFLEFDMLASI